jgi:DNA-binding beta-propeller fold protein YncE
MKKILLPTMGLLFLFACNDQQFNDSEDMELKSGKANGLQSFNFELASSLNIGGTGAAEISAFDPSTNKLFVVNNTVDDDDNVILNQIDVVDLTDPENPVKIGIINVGIYGGKVNSVDVNNGKLAAAIESDIKTDNGKIVVFKTDDYSVIAAVEAGALPDMVTFSPDGKLILSANEGEPNNEYTIDPVGSVSIIDILAGYDVTTLDFSGFSSMEEELKAEGFRAFGPNASFAQDIEPEYIAVAANSKKAWVSLQENNAIALIDLNSKTIEKIMPLGFKDYNDPKNRFDPSNEDGGVIFGNWPVYGMYQPDGIAVLSQGNEPFVYTANEGDSRDYDGFSEEERIKDILLDPVAFPNADFLQKKANLGRLNITTTLGDDDNDGYFNKLHSYGARSFSIWNGNTGKQMYDSGDFLDKTAVQEGSYDDGRSDDKGAEPEGVVIGRIANKNLLFVGMERADAVAVYDVTNPVKPKYLQWLNVGDAPEGILFISAEESPTGNPLLVVSSEGDGYITVFSTL